MNGDRGEMVSSRVTGVSPNVLSPVTGERELNEAVAWDRNLAVWYSTLWQLSWVLPYNRWVTRCAVTGVPAKKASVAAHHEYARWVCSGGWGRGHGQGKEFRTQSVSLSRSACQGWKRCIAGMCARWYCSPQTTFWGQKLDFSLRSTAEAINCPLASFHCFLAAWGINCHYFCIRFILRDCKELQLKGLAHFFCVSDPGTGF